MDVNKEGAGAARTSVDVEAELALAIRNGATEVAEKANGEGAGAADAVVVDDEAALALETAELDAGSKGWVPKHLYKKDPATWVDAPTYLKRRGNYTDNLKTELETMRAEMAEMKETRKAFAKFHEDSLKQKDEELKAAIVSLRLQRTEAIRNGEDDVALALEDRMEVLKEQQRTEATAKAEALAAAKALETAAPKPDPVQEAILAEWVEDDNKWFSDNPKMRDFAVALGANLKQNGEKATGREFLDIVATEIRRSFPRHFRAGAATPQVGAEKGNGAGTGAATHAVSAADLPEEDRKLMNQFIHEGYTTQETFLKSYNSRIAKR